MRKDQLVEMIEFKTSSRFTRVENMPTIKKLRQTAREMGLERVSRFLNGKLLKQVEGNLEEVRREEGTTLK